jgi:hypothetical protein
VIARLKYIQQFTDHNGHKRVYLRRRGHKPIPLPDTKDPKFFLAYQTALASTAPQKTRVQTGSLEALAASYYETATFKQLGTSTQTVYRRIITGLCEKHGAKLVSGLTTDAIQKAMDSRSDTPAAANHFLRTIRALMRHALDKRIIKVDPCTGVKRLKEVGGWIEGAIGLGVVPLHRATPVGRGTDGTATPDRRSAVGSTGEDQNETWYPTPR